MNRKNRRSAAAQGRRRPNNPAPDGPVLSWTPVAELYNKAYRHHQNGQLTEASALYQQILAIDPKHADSLHLLGVVAHQLGRNDIAIELIERAISVNDSAPEFHNSLGEALRVVGRRDDAIARYRRALALKPDYAEAHSNFGTALQEQGKLDEAIARYERALALKPNLADTHNNLGNALQDQGELDRAVTEYMQALALRANFAVAHNNLGNALRKLGKLPEATASLERALALRPDYAEAHNNLGNVLKDQGKLSEAILRYERALTLMPNLAEAHNNLGNALKDQGRYSESIDRYERAISLTPNYPEALTNLGSTLEKQRRLDEAVACYRRALELKPDFANAHMNLGMALHDQGNQTEAISQLEQAVALAPDHAGPKLVLCMAHLSVLYENESEIETQRAAYRSGLESLSEEIDTRGTLKTLYEAVGSTQPFFLAYQGLNDRDCQALYGSLVCRAMAQHYPPAAMPAPPGPGEPVRLGIVSGFFRNHSNWKLPIKGWLSQLDRRRFRVFGYYTGIERDEATALAVEQCDRFVQGPMSDDAWREAILADAPHVLIYPEVGMHPASVRLAAQRLAPVQCNSWGHPDTSGFPTLDYYLSSDLMEPPNGQDHYTERLVRLPNLSVYCEPLEAKPVSIGRSDLGLRAAATVYWCGQSLFKYLPQYDWVLPRIAQGAGDCQFAFIEYPRGEAVNDLFRARLSRAFSAVGLKSEDHCVILPRLEHEMFVAAAGQCDIVLDSIDWSGCNSTLEILPTDLPIVTMAAALMRGRHSMAILKMMGVSETVAETLDDYVSIAVRLARDGEWRAAIKTRIHENKHRVYRDDACISALDEFLDRAARSYHVEGLAPDHSVSDTTRT